MEEKKPYIKEDYYFEDEGFLELDTSFLEDNDFLIALNEDRNKRIYAKIIVLDKDERPINNIEGRVQAGSSINIDGNSAMRRTANITFVAEEEENDLTDIENLLSLNRKVELLVGIENNVNNYYNKIVWFPEGIYTISNPSLSHTTSSITINLNLKDKMSLLDGSAGGSLPTSVTFSEYGQYLELMEVEKYPERPLVTYIYHKKGTEEYKQWNAKDGWHDAGVSSAAEVEDLLPIDIANSFYDIVSTAVVQYGGENPANVFVNDLPLEIKQIVCWTGSETLYYNTTNHIYTLVQPEGYSATNSEWKAFSTGDEIGYVYTDFVCPSKNPVITGIGDNVVSALDKVKQHLGNYEYYYDTSGKFIFREKRNYLNTTYDPTIKTRLSNGGNRKVKIANNDLNIIDNGNYQVNFSGLGKSSYVFNKGTGLITSYSNNPQYENIKNDFHIWGKMKEGSVIHYHLAIKKKPDPADFKTWHVVPQKNKYNEYSGKVKLAKKDSDGNWEPGTVLYKSTDWRAELYLLGLEKKDAQLRPDIYEQELLDFFDSIYTMIDMTNPNNDEVEVRTGEFKTDLVCKPNELVYFIDYLEPNDSMRDYSVDVIGTRIYSYQQDNISKLYNMEVPNVMLVNPNVDVLTQEAYEAKCAANGLEFSQVDKDVWSGIIEGASGYSAEDAIRELLYQYTTFNEAISISCIPIYYLEPNTRITVEDEATGINGDYVIQSISLPLDGSPMSISAIRSLDRDLI